MKKVLLFIFLTSAFLTYPAESTKPNINYKNFIKTLMQESKKGSVINITHIIEKTTKKTAEATK